LGSFMMWEAASLSVLMPGMGSEKRADQGISAGCG
jgi:hypothetical protein